ncbi:hypothetical protein, partial [Rhodoplanes sp. SY1]|uniref:hypothetical protein n=1 Tax=Rhodoplanes sp. SY1 TaxID=3166646 RepID=UPI0038B4F6CF
SPTGNGKTSGTDEEWSVALELYEEKRIRNIGLFFKHVDPSKLNDPGPQLSRVLAFKTEIEAGKKHLFKAYGGVEEFCETLEEHLSKWLRDHGTSEPASLSSDASVAASTPADAKPSTVARAGTPSFAFWIDESRTLLDQTPTNAQEALFCANRAFQAAETELGRANA